MKLYDPDVCTALRSGADEKIMPILEECLKTLNRSVKICPTVEVSSALGAWQRCFDIERLFLQQAGGEAQYIQVATLQNPSTGAEFINLQVFDSASFLRQTMVNRCYKCLPYYEAGMKVNRSEPVIPAELSERTQKAIIEMFDEGLQTSNSFYRPGVLVEECFSQLFGASVWRVDIATPDIIRTTKWEMLLGEGWDHPIAATLLNLYKSRFNGPIETSIHFYNFEHSPHDNSGKWAIEFRTIVNGPENRESFWLEVNGTLHRVDSSVVSRLPDPEMRSVAEPVFLMSAKAVREAWGGELEDWKYDAIIKWGTENGWSEVIRYGRQLLFIAKPQLL